MADDAREDNAAPAAGGLGLAITSGMRGESISARGILDLIGGVRGLLESLVPATLFLVFYVLTQDARISAIAPLVVSAIAVLARLINKESLSGALSGAVGVIVCVVATMLTGRGEDYFLPGFWINGAWIAAHTVSLLVGWPLVGLLLGFFRGSLTQWRTETVLRRAAQVCTVVWIAVFAARLAVQLPLYAAAGSGDPGAVEALGVARLVMGVPLFAIAAVFTWLVLSRVSSAFDALTSADAEESAATVDMGASDTSGNTRPGGDSGTRGEGAQASSE